MFDLVLWAARLRVCMDQSVHFSLRGYQATAAGYSASGIALQAVGPYGEWSKFEKLRQRLMPLCLEAEKVFDNVQ